MDTANGEGISTTLFVSGCNFHCKGCFNEEAWNFNYGKPFTKEIEYRLIEYAKNVHVNHVSLLGGEIFHQDLNIISHLVKRIKVEVNKPIWLWTGFEWEKLIKDKQRLNILKYVDVVVDGRFEQDKYNPSLLWKGSSGQRIIDVETSLNENKVILHTIGGI